MALIEICVDRKNVRTAIYVGMYVLAVVESKVIIPDGIYYYPNVPLYCLIPWNADVCLFAVPFMAIGKYVKESASEKQEVCFNGKSKQVLLMAAVALFALFSTLKVCDFYSVEIVMKYVHYSNLILCAVLPLSAGVILIKGAMALASGGYAATALCEIGKASLVIMYTHLLIRDYIKIPTYGENYSVILWAIITCISGILIRDFAKKNKFSSMIILGK